MPRARNPEQARANRIAALQLANAANKKRVATGGLTRRHMRIVLLHLGGHTNEEIAKRVGMSSGEIVSRTLRMKHVKAEMDRILQAQRERIIAGEFGVQAMAKASAERMAKTIIDQATGDAPDVKPGDRRKAAEVGLKIAGEFTNKTVHEHIVSLIRGLSDEELREVQAHHRWPVRLREHLTKLGVPIEVAALPSP